MTPSRRAVVGCLALVVALFSSGPAWAAVGLQQWHLAFLRIPQAQAVSDGAGVIVAVVDTGVDAKHPDLSGSVLPGVDHVPRPASDDGGVDLDGHGTGMAGLVSPPGHGPGLAPEA